MPRAHFWTYESVQCIMRMHMSFGTKDFSGGGECNIVHQYITLSTPMTRLQVSQVCTGVPLTLQHLLMLTPVLFKRYQIGISHDTKLGFYRLIYYTLPHSVREPIYRWSEPTRASK